MGKLVITIGAGDPQGDRFHDVEVTVDTGSTFTALPGSMLRELGVPVERTARARLADGSGKNVDIGHTMVRLEGRTFPTPVTFAGPAEPSSWVWSPLRPHSWPSTPSARDSYRSTPTSSMRLDREGTVQTHSSDRRGQDSGDATTSQTTTTRGGPR